MSLKIRLARAGTKKRPFYHIVIADSRSPRDGRFIERLGYFNPLLPREKTERLKIDLDKVKAWLAKGATPTDRVLGFLDEAGVVEGEERRNPEEAIPRQERKVRHSGKGNPRKGAQGAGRRTRKARSGREAGRHSQGRGGGEGCCCTG